MQEANFFPQVMYQFIEYYISTCALLSCYYYFNDFTHNWHITVFYSYANTYNVIQSSKTSPLPENINLKIFFPTFLQINLQQLGKLGMLF